MDYTEEQKKKYMDNGGGICPKCGSTDISGSCFDVESELSAWQPVVCNNCGEQWNDIYKLVDVERK